MRVKKVIQNVVADSQKITKKIWRKKTFRKIIFAVGIFIFGLAGLFFIFNLSYQNKILPHTKIGSINFGGLSRAQAIQLLNQQISASKDEKIAYNFEGKEYVISNHDLGLDYTTSENQTIDHLFAIGRLGSLGKILKETIYSVFSKNRVYAQFSINEGKLNEYLGQIAKNIDIAEEDATLEIKAEKPVVIKEKVGRKFEIIENKAIMSNSIGSFNFLANQPFKISALLPKIDSKTAEAAISETEKLIKSQLTIIAKDKTFELKGDNIISMIEFVGRPNPDKIAKNQYILSAEISQDKMAGFTKNIAAEVYQEPKDPKFKATDGKVSAFQLAQTGYELDQEKAVIDIIDAIKTGKEKIELLVKVTEPVLADDDPTKLGLKEQISVGRTSWRGSPSNRIHNLTLGANKISGTIVKPGEEFSTVKTIGKIDASTGFLPELVIKNSNQVTPEYGGGLCQVSTTLFRAALNAGLEITSRTPHSFRVSYYEPPAGMDATIYDPAPDFKFINNMSTPIFIWAITGDNSLAFEIYGTKDGRNIEITEPTLYNYTSPGAPIYTEVGSMEAGEIRQVERATSGATASFNYKVTSAAGKVLQQETYISVYVPVPDSFLYGPGTPDIPVPAPEAPPEGE